MSDAIRLKYLATISVGLNLRNTQRYAEGTHLGLSSKYVTAEGIDYDALQGFDPLGGVGNALLKKGDILIHTKEPFHATVFNSDLENVIASDAFRIVRVNDATQIMPEYLAATLNDSVARNFFRQHSPMTVLSYLNTKVLGDVPIVIPPLDKQIKVMNLVASTNKLIVLSMKKVDLLRQMSKSVVHQAIKDEANISELTGRMVIAIAEDAPSAALKTTVEDEA